MSHSALKPALLFLMFCGISMHAQTLTTGEVYDVEIGDKHAYTEYVYRGTSAPPTYVFKKVIDKTIYGRDSLKLKYYVGTYGYEYPNWVNKNHELNLTLYQLDSPFYKLFSMIDTFYRFYSSSDTLKQNPYGQHLQRDSVRTDTCGSIINIRYKNTATALSGGSISSHMAYKGLGEIVTDYSYESNVYGIKQELAYYYRKQSYCGSNMFPVNLEQPAWLQLAIAPNPATDVLEIQLPLNGIYTIYNQFGQQILTGILTQNNGSEKIDISALSAGVYTITLISDQQRYNAKFIRQ